MGRRRVVVAGIGGLALAGVLRRMEDEVVVLERVPEIRPIGAGIVLAANAILALRRMGLGDEVVPAGAPLETAQILRMIPPRAVEARLRRLLLTSDVLASPPPDGVP